MASGCIHTRQARTKEILAAYKLAVRLAHAAKKGKTFKCDTCSKLGPLRVCLECTFVGCLAHGHQHSKEEGHALGVDMTGEGMVYCYECEDYVVDESFEAAVRGPNARMPTKIKGGIGTLPPFQATTGLRGFCNMGATCFISVILQSLLHNPLVRNFFLAGGHDRRQCDRDFCIECCVDDLFVEFYKSSSIQDVGPTQLLEASWRLKRSLAGGSEQDAHEFLQFVLDEFHKSHFQSTVLARVEDENDFKFGHGETEDMACGCISHRTFCGELESRISCEHCGNVTTTIDPMMDLSLEVRNSLAGVTLESCLDKFTSTERLDVPYHCAQCRTKRSVNKQLGVKKLPFVLSIQLKRFEHTTLQGSKIETAVKFPLYLDMAKYTTSPHDTGLTYELFGLVCHQGSINTGHYTCYMKDRTGRWFYFDDSVVTIVSPKAALSATSSAYLLFYILDRI